jgi:hypothetical protein
MADVSLWGVVIGGLLGIGGTIGGSIATALRDKSQQEYEIKKKRAEKFEELVAAVYEFDHWLSAVRDRRVVGQNTALETVSPFSKVQAISSVYFQQFSKLVRELEFAADQYQAWTYSAQNKRLDNKTAVEINDGYEGAYRPYAEKREVLLDALQKFARNHFQ